MSTSPTFDPAALVAAVNRLGSPVIDEVTGDLIPASLRLVARRIGVDPSVLCRPLSLNQADRYCIELGLHPAEVWGAEYTRPQRKVNRRLQP